MKKHSDFITVTAFCLVIAILAVSFVIIPDRAFSQQENRNLAQIPQLNGESFFSGEYGKEMNSYFSDQFPLRDWFVKLKSSAELAFFKGENNGVLYSYGQLAVKDFTAYINILEKIENTDRIYTQSAELQLQCLNNLAEKLSAPMVTVIPPRTIDIADTVFDYDRPDGDRLFTLADSVLSEKTGYINCLDNLRTRYANGEYVYYRTDHHWTTLGAYYVYCDIMTALGRQDKIIPKEEFDIEQINDFSGTTAARASFPFYKKDVLELWHLDDDADYEITADGEALTGFYEMSYAKVSDKYSVFLDGTHNVTEIKKKGVERDTLLVVKDSFANCLIPFLAREFDIIAVNIHNINAISAMAENYGADGVLVLCNAENLISTGDVGKLN